MALLSKTAAARAMLACALLRAVPAPARFGDGGRSEQPVDAAAVSRYAAGANTHDAFARGGAARGLSYWVNASTMTTAMSDLEGSAESLMGYEYLATTTHYNDTTIASCGKLDTAELVAGTGYYAVASAEAMQSVFPQGGCCWCGSASATCGHGLGTAPMGCMSCARGRFLAKRPYPAPMPGSAKLFEQEYNLVVADICPHVGNEAWCPPTPGSLNSFGSKNHFDFAAPPPGHDNFYFAFTPVPCSTEIQHRLSALSQCGR